MGVNTICPCIKTGRRVSRSGEKGKPKVMPGPPEAECKCFVGDLNKKDLLRAHGARA